jgi:hypothetical protein
MSFEGAMNYAGQGVEWVLNNPKEAMEVIDSVWSKIPSKRPAGPSIKQEKKTTKAVEETSKDANEDDQGRDYALTNADKYNSFTKQPSNSFNHRTNRFLKQYVGALKWQKAIIGKHVMNFGRLVPLANKKNWIGMNLGFYNWRIDEVKAIEQQSGCSDIYDICLENQSHTSTDANKISIVDPGDVTDLMDMHQAYGTLTISNQEKTTHITTAPSPTSTTSVLYDAKPAIVKIFFVKTRKTLLRTELPQTTVSQQQYGPLSYGLNTLWSNSVEIATGAPYDEGEQLHITHVGMELNHSPVFSKLFKIVHSEEYVLPPGDFIKFNVNGGTFRNKKISDMKDRLMDDKSISIIISVKAFNVVTNVGHEADTQSSDFVGGIHVNFEKYYQYKIHNGFEFTPKRTVRYENPGHPTRDIVPLPTGIPA